jgi:uncharacterized Zn-binding protein involved in type VI secretion
MPPAARQGDPTGHPGLVASGNPTVLIGNQPAATMSDLHTCMMPPPAGPHGTAPFARGSATVTIGGSPALRMGDTSGCGAPVTFGFPTVTIGG